MRTVALVVGLVIVSALSPSGADAAHEAYVCGQLLEYVRAASDDIRHGYAHVRLATPTGDTGVLFHDTNPSKAPSRIQPGATRQGAQICISGPYVHVLGSSPYVSPYDLRLATAGSLPGTSTAVVANGRTSNGDKGPADVGLLIVTTGVALLVVALRRRSATYRP